MTFKEYFSRSPLLFYIIAINVAVTALVGIFSLSGVSVLPFLALPANFSLFVSRPWTALTYMFTQSSFLHLLFNMLWLLWFGRIFLYVASPRSFLLTYLCGGLAGALFYICVCAFGGSLPGSFLIGSSAAVLAVMTAAAVMTPNLELRIFLISGVRLKYVALLCILLTFLGIGGGTSGGFSAHFGGVAFGLIAPMLFKDSSSHSYLSGWLAQKWSKIRMKAKRRKVPEVLLRAPRHATSLPSDKSNTATHSFSDEQRLDELLDKVRVSGYASLSESEKRELNAISSRL